ncbi:hypothetical protein O6H91_20G003100 [Diphasiastrum complanatum]|uniref:Uncharacterized protein n=1 Tax=Diphasiastrum complanatum TaxID=34168 RepID=A0ACC2AMG8_DIPCM|nr:hypothetical protein O6H91_20G003100 [Diphasiastrum complanatum]
MERWSYTDLAALVMIMACCVTFAATGADAQAAAPPPLDCSSDLILLLPCLNFVTGTDPKPSTDCCSGLTQILNTTPLCLCQILQSQAGPGSGVNLTLAFDLPKYCNVPDANPNRCSGPAPAPAPVPPVPAPATVPPAPAPSPVPAPAPSVTPASPPTVTPSSPPTVPTSSPPSPSPSPTLTTPPPSPSPTVNSPPPPAPTPAPAPTAPPPPVAIPAPSPVINATQTPGAGGPSGGQLAPPPSAAPKFTASIWIYMGLAAVSAFLHML